MGQLEREIKWEFDRDLSTLACHAAIELDSLISGDYRGLNSVQELAKRIDKTIPLTEGAIQLSLLDPDTVVIMNQAIVATNIEAHVDSINDYIKEASSISEELNNISSLYGAAETIEGQKLEELKEFCLVLSKKASIFQQTQDTEIQHPYKV